VCDLTIAADNAIFGQTGPKVGSFDAGYGATLLARIVGHKKAREIWYLCRQYDAQQALEMGLVNTVVPLARLEEETVSWCREMLAMSPTALRFLKASFNADALAFDPKDSQGVNVGNNAVAYWGVADIAQAYTRLLDQGAVPRQPVMDVGGDIQVAAVADPFGNVIGLIQNPHFKIKGDQ